MANFDDFKKAVLNNYTKSGVKSKSKKDSKETLMQLLLQLEVSGQGQSFLARTYRTILNREENPGIRGMRTAS